MIFSGAVTNKVTYLDLIMILGKPIQLFWYLYVLLMYYALFRVDKIRNMNSVLFISISGIISLVSGYVPPISWFQVNNFLYYGFFFAFGMNNKRFIGNRLALRGGTAYVSYQSFLSSHYGVGKDISALYQLPIVL